MRSWLVTALGFFYWLGGVGALLGPPESAWAARAYLLIGTLLLGLGSIAAAIERLEPKP